MEFTQKNIKQLSQEVATKASLNPKHVQASLELLDEGNTIPFIARYRKEQTGSMSDESLREIELSYQSLLDLEARKQTVFNTLNDLEIEDEAIFLSVLKAGTLKEVEDLYRPYKPKKRTRASMAKERGLQPLADLILARGSDSEVESLAKQLLTIELKEGVKPLADIEEAYQGASDILAESASDDPKLRDILRKEYLNHGLIKSTSKVKEDTVYRLYYNYQEPLNKIASHRYL
ncbi:MAG: RNA-binding transcriptional accessory protein, partial [Erysipelothrix sp.]|nr:RNA-binding transcriptional accessory protein [Erysipelothrix sp.]